MPGDLTDEEIADLEAALAAVGADRDPDDFDAREIDLRQRPPTWDECAAYSAAVQAAPDLVAEVRRLRAGEGVLAEVRAERARQDAKWGAQDHPSLTSGPTRDGGRWVFGPADYEIPREDRVWVCQYCAAEEPPGMDAARIAHRDGCAWVRARALLAGGRDHG